MQVHRAQSVRESATPSSGAITDLLSRGRNALATALAGATVLVLYVWDDAIFATPVVVATRWWGAATAFVTLFIAYAAGSWLVAVLGVRTYDRSVATRAAGRDLSDESDPDRPSRLARWIDHQAGGRRGPWGKRLVASGELVGFVVASFLLGGIVTTWLVRLSGRRHRMGLVAIASSTIFAISFVGFYSGTARVLLGGS